VGNSLPDVKVKFAVFKSTCDAATFHPMPSVCLPHYRYRMCGDFISINQVL
jgi:hypothetical protein